METTRFEARAEALQRVPRRDLRATAFVHEPCCADALLAQIQSLSFQARKPRAVDGFEWQAELKTLLGPRVERRRSLECSAPDGLLPVTRETDRPRLGPGRPP